MLESLKRVAQGDRITDFRGQWIIYEAQRRGGPTPKYGTLLQAADVNAAIDWLSLNHPKDFTVATIA